ncbi:MAG: hypothetical protein VKL39_04910 [Leptolyngbyaceae bacterium]|nr:hypothetical protein [Leptolyngbyaceae bacterium]
MSIPRNLLSSSVLSGAVFSAATIPMLAMGDQPIEINLGGEPFFIGTVDDLAAPYLGLVTAASLGMGVTTLSVLGWSQSSSKATRSEDKIMQLRKDLRDRESAIEQLRFSDARLEAAGLGSFIDDDNVHSEFEQPQHFPSAEPAPAPQPVAQAQPYAATYQVVRSVGNGDRPVGQARQNAQPTTQAHQRQVQRIRVPAQATAAPSHNGSQRMAQAAVKPPLPPQPKFQQAPSSAVASHTRSNGSPARPQGHAVPATTGESHPDQLNDLLAQMQNLMSQVEQMQQGTAVA